MTLMNGSKKARNAASLINLPSGGGSKKQGLPSTIGIPSTIVAMYQQRVGYCCLSQNILLPHYTVSWKGTVGMVGIYRR
jgi:hypothetical protein